MRQDLSRAIQNSVERLVDAGYMRPEGLATHSRAHRGRRRRIERSNYPALRPALRDFTVDAVVPFEEFYSPRPSCASSSPRRSEAGSSASETVQLIHLQKPR